MRTLIAVLAPFLFASVLASAQTGFPSFGSFENGRFDSTNRQNLNTNFAIPITSAQGRGLGISLALVYDSIVYAAGASSWSPIAASDGAINWGWKMTSPFGGTCLGIGCSNTYSTQACIDSSGLKIIQGDHVYGHYVYTDGMGTQHMFPVVVHDRSFCDTGYGGVYTGYASDNSGYYIDVTPPDNTTNPIVYSPSGMGMVGLGSVTRITDPNGNYITRSVASNVTTWLDTLNRTALTITDNRTSNPPNTSYQYLAEDGTPLNIQVNYTAYSIKTNFQCLGVSEYASTGTVLLPTQVVFLPGDPHQLSYTLSYEDTPGFAGFKTGRLTQVTLPSGGSYQYQYYALPANPAVDHGGVNCADGTYVYLTKTINDGVAPSTWSFTRDLATLTTKETPPSVAPDSGAHAVYTFAGNGQQSSVIFYRDTAETPANKLKTVNTTWAANGTPASQVTILDNNKQSQLTTVFSSNGLLQSKSEYDYGQGVVGPLIRTTTFTYLNSSAYVAKNILNRLTQQKVADANGTVFSRTDIAYDCYTAPCAALASSGYTGVTHHDDVNYGASNTIRGNPTQITVFSNAAAGSGQLTTNLTYNILGNVISSADPKGNATTFSYADSWNNATCAPVGGSQAYVTSVTNALNQTSSSKYNSCTGTLASATDLNGRTTSFTYDSYARPLTTAFPDGGSSSVSYADGSNSVISVSQVIDSGKTLSTSTHLDGLGRVVQTTKSTPGGTVFVDTAYDARGHVASVTNPHYSTSSPTDGSTSFLYDGLGRQVKVTNPDGSYSQAAFKGPAVALADEGNGNANPVEKLQQFDALGRLLKVCEVTNAALIGGDTTPVSCGFDLNAISARANGFVTSYTYDVLDNLLSVNQGSALLSRAFAYDSLSRMTSSAIPETTTAADNTPRATTFSYTAGAALCSGDPSNPCSATDPRGVTTTVSYDALNRTTQKQYSDGTPTASYFYDEGASGGQTLLNTKGRLSHYQAAAGQALSYFSYDPMGRVLHNWQCTPTAPNSCTTFAIDYTYDYLGDLLSRTDMGGTIAYSYSYDSAAQLTLMQMTVNATTSNILSAISYNPLGQPTAATLGPTGSTMALTRAYNNRGQLLSMQNGSVYSIGSSGNPIQYHPDGNIKFLPDSVNGSWTYAYDDFNRLVSAAKGGGATYTFDYDRFGNRWHENVNGSPQSNLTFDNKNHITNSGYAYDSGGSGNMINDSFNTLTWDGQNRLLQANNGSAVSSYTYDAVGWRVQKTTGPNSVQYLFDTGGNVTEELNGSTLNRAEIYLGGAHLGTYTGGNVYFSHTDPLGTERARTLSTAQGSASQACTGLPFGDGQSCIGTESSPLHFTAFQRDTETGLDQSWFRKYSSAQGRWLTPDPAAGSMAPGDPQSLNRFAYVSGNPINAVDPFGLEDCSWGCMWDWWTQFFGGSHFRVCSGWSGGPVGDGGHFTDCESISFPDQPHQPGAGKGPAGGGSSEGQGKSNSPCRSIPSTGATFPIRINSESDFRLQFDGNGQLIGIGIQLTGSQAGKIQDISIPAHTYVGITLNSPTTVSFGFSNPVKFSQGVASVKQAYFQAASFSNGRFANVRGAWAPFGVPMGSTTGSSSILQNALNGQQSAIDLATSLLKAANLISNYVSCSSIFGGG